MFPLGLSNKFPLNEIVKQPFFQWLENVKWCLVISLESGKRKFEVKAFLTFNIKAE